MQTHENASFLRRKSYQTLTSTNTHTFILNILTPAKQLLALIHLNENTSDLLVY